ncbi:putative uncharacterized protein [Parachlamydia acanthamoebae UV-7]|jgi:hypothetical protein|uniref:Uncharacterized protein n=2 Tax=Parachlamydia acanthamoebae TaxID=83552 RepID=F8KZR2_PARAV|nr:hypothetical protein [Parachlamydia acanthamoebae]EFB42434.1 hypothetical protein pah_c008o046 [Parachlamydia acanthamoebae str. Hall's coccus]KIA77871.1 hypothetical protein DB43_FM00230 [Parachlamydia acanthamoebae]CCB86416.1 putative uncharacterized protein [Parachlamydia acanthamoebae UV-7]
MSSSVNNDSSNTSYQAYIDQLYQQDLQSANDPNNPDNNTDDGPDFGLSSTTATSTSKSSKNVDPQDAAVEAAIAGINAAQVNSQNNSVSSNTKNASDLALASELGIDVTQNNVTDTQVPTVSNNNSTQDPNSLADTATRPHKHTRFLENQGKWI